jgi:hypothetical protein
MIMLLAPALSNVGRLPGKKTPPTPHGGFSLKHRSNVVQLHLP